MGKDKPKFKPCPKCGSDDVSHHYDSYWDRLECYCRHCEHRWGQEPLDRIGNRRAR